MKHLLFLLPSLFLFISCHRNSQQEIQRDGITTANNVQVQQPAASKQLIQKFAPFLHGVWVGLDYVKSIEKTRSPYASRDEFYDVAEMSIDTNDITKDSLIVGVSYGNHEGGCFMILLHPGLTPTSLPTNYPYFGEEVNMQKEDYYELGYSLHGNDTTLIFYHYNHHHKLLGRRQYVRVIETVAKDAGGGDGIQYFVNKKLIAGSYTLRKSDGSSYNISLSADGKMSGFPDFKSYYIITDFVVEEGVVDQICLDGQTPNQHCYVLKIYQQNVYIYEAIHDKENDMIVTKGALVYTLMRNQQ